MNKEFDGPVITFMDKNAEGTARAEAAKHSRYKLKKRVLFVPNGHGTTQDSWVLVLRNRDKELSD